MFLRSIILIPALVSTTLLLSQITITSEDLPNGAVNYEVADALGLDLPDYTNGGAGVTWDFSSIESINDDVVSYVNISSAPFTYQFLFNSPFTPNYQATHAIEGEGVDLFVVSIDEFFFFFKNTETEYNIVGYGGTVNGIPIPSQTNPIDVVYALPIEFGDEHESNSAWSVEIPTLGSYAQTQNRTYTVDGWGTVITPAGSFEAIRVRMETQITDNITVEALGQDFTFDRASIAYQWLSPGEGIPVMEITENFGQATVRYKTGTEVSIADHTSARQGVTVYPTVTNDRFTVDGIKRGDEVTLYDGMGRLVRTFQDGVDCSVGDLTAGWYVVKVQSDSGIHTSRIMVQP